MDAKPNRWRTRTGRLAVAGAVAMVIAGGGAVAMASTGNDDGPRGPGGRYQDFAPAPDGADPGRPGRIGVGMPDALHGEFVAADGDGFVTNAMQVGEITELDDDAITLRSTDGFTREYGLGDPAPDGLAVGDRARVLAKVEDDSATVVRLGGGDRRDRMPQDDMRDRMPPEDMRRDLPPRGPMGPGYR